MWQNISVGLYHDINDMPIMSIKLNNLSHWVKVAGAGPPVLALHGGPGGNHQVFEHTTGPLLERFTRMIYLESRGCGRSQAPEDGDWSIPTLLSDIDDLLTLLDLPEVHVLGSSFGAGLATTYALSRPHRVKSLILQSPWWFGEDLTEHQISGFLPLLPEGLRAEVLQRLQHQDRPLDVLEFIWSEVSTEVADRFLFEQPEVAALNRRMWEEGGLVNTGEMHAFLLQHPPEPIANRLGDLTCPVLVLAGRQDRNVSTRRILELAGGLVRGSVVVFEQSAHFPELEETHDFVGAIRSFLAAQTIH